MHTNRKCKADIGSADLRFHLKIKNKIDTDENYGRNKN